MKNIVVRKYSADDIPAMKDIWNEVVDEGVAFPQEDELTDGSAREFFAQQTYCGVAVGEDGKVYGMYILHPNNVGRCGHIANASYAENLDKYIRSGGFDAVICTHLFGMESMTAVRHKKNNPVQPTE